MSAALELLCVRTKEGLDLLRAGVNVNDGHAGGYIQNFTRDGLVTAKIGGSTKLTRNQLIYSNRHQAHAVDSRIAAERGKYHHQLPGVKIDGREYSTEYAASDTTALAIDMHATYETVTRDRDLARTYRQNLLEALEVYIPSHLDSKTQMFFEDPKLCGAKQFGLLRTDWKDSETVDREDGQVAYPVEFPVLQGMYMRALRAASQLFDTREFARWAEGMRRGLQALYDPERGSFYAAVDRFGPVQAVTSDGLHMFAYLDLEDLKPGQWVELIKGAEVLETVAGYQTIDPETATRMKDQYHARVWPFEQAIINRGARRLQKQARQLGLPWLIEPFEHVKEVSSSVYPYLDTEPETLIVRGCMVEKAGCDPQAWTWAAKEYFRRMLALGI